VNYKRAVISARERELLLLRAQTGDTEALDLLFESCRRRLYHQALRILARPQDAEDAVQEAMLAAFTRLHQFQGRADFLTWATRIVTNAALQHIRKTRTKPTVAWNQADKEFDGVSFSEYSRDPQPTPEEQFQGLEHARMLKDALHELPVESRRPIQLCRLSDYSMKEAASVLGLSVSTLKVRLHRGKQALMVGLKRKTKVQREPASSKRSLQHHPSSKASLCAA
jgi:RNA polymerase sigma-70 factor, ECF subfamily